MVLASEEFRSQQAGSGFEVLFRLYRPQKPLFDNSDHEITLKSKVMK